mmetsp:Transcript_32415/g.96563  ORF Transcript_32415/g.96563 Transcript_32415/m.96563 type:complete len:452 (-) Transcript_32415:119-1474(-)
MAEAEAPSCCSLPGAVAEGPHAPRRRTWDESAPSEAAPHQVQESGGQVHPEDSAQPFSHVLSFGSRCLVARVLQEAGVRKYAGPFDWIYSTVEMVRHCLQDRFEVFLAPEQLQRAGHAWGHQTYGPMIRRGVVFPHHEPLERDRSHFVRSAERLRHVLASPERKLLVLAHVVRSRKELRLLPRSLLELRSLFDDLRTQGVSNFELAAVHVVEGRSKWRCGPSGTSEVPKVRAVHDTGHGCERLVLHELQCVGGCTGLRFKSALDEEALRSIILDRRHRFALQPDPLPPTAPPLRRKQRRLMGDPISPLPKRRCCSAAKRQRRLSGELGVRHPATEAPRCGAARELPGTILELSEDEAGGEAQGPPRARQGSRSEGDMALLLEQMAAEGEEAWQREVAAARAQAAAAAVEAGDPGLAEVLEASAHAFAEEARHRREAQLAERALTLLLGGWD